MGPLVAEVVVGALALGGVMLGIAVGPVASRSSHVGLWDQLILVAIRQTRRDAFVEQLVSLALPNWRWCTGCWRKPAPNEKWL